ncbi:MAG: hypothetical protein R3182_11455, partial [Draconibacterium sp.]|nr:hypothetical protein [Draconibacterium sp.]
MFFRKSALIFSLTFFIFLHSQAQHQALKLIDKKDLKRHLSFLASDELQGRKLGTEVDGLGITADYLAENAKRVGLKPSVENYFQSVKMVASKPNDQGFIEIQNSDGKSVFKSNTLLSFVRTYHLNEIKNESVVLAGFGYNNPETDY